MEYAKQLPSSSTPFIGRRQELAEIGALLANPDCHLLTLLGPGGIGKTRLAIEAARRFSTEAGVEFVFVSLQSVHSADTLVSAVAAAVGISLTGQNDPTIQLIHQLRDRQVWLVLDNFEHLLDPGWPYGLAGAPVRQDQLGASSIGLLSDLLAAAPGVQMLVTSREALNVQDEWLYPLAGLETPNIVASSDAMRTAAVQLFVERARRARRDFAPEAEQEALIRICRLVEGMPLALELAAAWTKALPCAAIAAEITASLAFLATSMRDVPERHRSMWAVFDQSWARLAADERAVFTRLAVFQGGFSLEAATSVCLELSAESAAAAQHEIAGSRSTSYGHITILNCLASLVDKSLLRNEPSGRYQIHELLRQYAMERLREDPAEAERAQTAHSSYYIAFLHQRHSDLTSGRQCEATEEIAIELANVRAAWHWAIAHTDIAAIDQAGHVLTLYYKFRGSFQEGVQALTPAAQRLRRSTDLQQHTESLARVLNDLGTLYARSGRLVEARQAFAESLALDVQCDAPPSGLMTDPAIGLGVVAVSQGRHSEAAQLGEQARCRNEQHQHRRNLPYIYHLLATVARVQGHYRAAQQYARQAHTAALATQDRWWLSHCLIELGHIACARGAYTEARQHYQTSYTIRESFNDQKGVAGALLHAGYVALREQHYRQAQAQFERSLAIHRAIGDQHDIAHVLHGLGQVACALGDYDAAQRWFAQALPRTAAAQYTLLALQIFASGGQLLKLLGKPEWGVELAVFVLRHPASDRDTSERAQQLLLTCEAVLAAEQLSAAVQRGQTNDLAGTTPRLLAELTTPLQSKSATEQHPQPSPESSPPDDLLTEPLNTRELEVLRLIAAGRSNQEIADQLILALGTVKWYVRQIFGKLTVRNRTEAVARARILKLQV
ncbi:MAG: tetratricopeptide repeat protein [Chloroflexales bacterium]|nr:tetratricopeptide repeat protein [Chloroflexales bacterium]